MRFARDISRVEVRVRVRTRVTQRRSLERLLVWVRVRGGGRVNVGVRDRV